MGTPVVAARRNTHHCTIDLHDPSHTCKLPHPPVIKMNALCDLCISYVTRLRRYAAVDITLLTAGYSSIQYSSRVVDSVVGTVLCALPYSYGFKTKSHCRMPSYETSSAQRTIHVRKIFSSDKHFDACMCPARYAYTYTAAQRVSQN